MRNHEAAIAAAERGDYAEVERLGFPVLAGIVMRGYLPPRVIELKAERDELLGRNRLTARQARRLNEIRTELDSLPYGESKLEFDARRIIRDAAKTLEKKGP